jgi:hypothetical protein
MVDFQTTTTLVGKPINKSWLHARHGQEVAVPGQLNASLFTADTHYPTTGATAYIIPSGVAVGRVTATGRYGPYDSTAVDGRAVLAGYINDDEGVELIQPVSGAKPTFALLKHGVIKASKLPITAQRTAVLTANSTGSFIYSEA